MVLHFAAIVNGDLSRYASALWPGVVKDDNILVLGHAPPLRRSIDTGVIGITELCVHILILVLRVVVATELHGLVIDWYALSSSSCVLSRCENLHERCYVVRYSQRAVVVSQADYLYSGDEIVRWNILGSMTIIFSQECRYSRLVIVQIDEDLHDLSNENED